MRLIKIGIASIDTTVGALKSNTDKIISAVKEMAGNGCTIGCFHECAISGYPCEDLIQWKGFVSGQYDQLERIARECGSLGKGIVISVGLTAAVMGNLYNCIAVINSGKIKGLVPKEKLPTYGVFYENRTFSRGIPGKAILNLSEVMLGDMIFSFPFGKVAVEVCEDLWSPDGPMRRRAYSGAEMVINASASPWRMGIVQTREELISTRAYENQVTLVYVNQVGANDSLVFDGGGYVNQNGRMLLEAPRWKEGISYQVVDLDRTSRLRRENTTWRSDFEIFHKENKPVQIIDAFEASGPQSNNYLPYPLPTSRNFFVPSFPQPENPRKKFFEELISVLVAGLSGYFRKTAAFKKIGIALSGGRDSILTLIIAWYFAQQHFSGKQSGGSDVACVSLRDFIRCFSLPSRFNTKTKEISRQICEDLGVSLTEVGIETEVGVANDQLEKMLCPGERITGIAMQNVQARVRGAMMWNWSNCSEGMWLQTSNMSEKAVGYTTIGADMMGVYSILGNVPKTLINAMLQYLYEKHGWKGLGMLLQTKSSAELASNQSDERDLMPFPVLDMCITLFVEEKLDKEEALKVLRVTWSDDELRAMDPRYEEGMLKEWMYKFIRLFKNSIFKWVQSPKSVHVGSIELDSERALQLPIVQSMEWVERREKEDA